MRESITRSGAGEVDFARDATAELFRGTGATKE